MKDADERKVGRAFSDANVHTALSGIPGMYGLGGKPGPGTPFGEYRPATVPSELEPQYVHLSGRTWQVESVAPTGEPIEVEPWDPGGSIPDGPTVDVPLGRIVGARSGDKGGNANVGVFVRSDATTPELSSRAAQAWAWLDAFLTVERLQELLPETADLAADRYRFPRIMSLNFVIRGLLEEGVAASSRQDAQAKAVGEWLRARVVPIPVSLLD
mgnify:CR=1 FL=1